MNLYSIYYKLLHVVEKYKTRKEEQTEGIGNCNEALAVYTSCAQGYLVRHKWG